MTVQPTRDQPMTNHDRMNYWWRRATQAEAERDEWRQTALDERAAALDALEQVKVRDARIEAVRELHVKEPGVGTAYCVDCEQPLPCDTIRALEG